LINLDDLRGHSAITLLGNYEGVNPYLVKLRNEYLKNKKLGLTENQSKYILDNHDKEPLYINRVIGITKYLGEELKKTSDLSFTPEKLLVEFILAETEKTYHVYGKLKQNQKESMMYWLPKTQVTDDPYFENIDIDIDFSKYNDVLALDGKTLYQHQKDGIKFLLTRNGCILADDMGLGKSMQAIIAALESGAKNILIVCPSSTKINWEREINVFCDDTFIIDGQKWGSAKFTIINFDILKNFHGLGPDKKPKKDEPQPILARNLVEAKYDLCIIDEAHNLKNSDSKRGKIMVELCVKHGIEKTWLLTGTPVANRPMDFFNLLSIIKSPVANNWKHYALRYCDGKRFFKTLKNGVKKQIWITNGASNLEELSSKTKNILLRRLKTEALDMPDKVITTMYHNMDNKGWKMYDDLWDEYLIARKAQGKKTGNLQKDLVELILLRQFIAIQAIPYTIEMVENAIEMGRKVIIFTSFTEELDILSNHFGKLAVTHNGLMTMNQKQKSVDSFQNDDKIKVFIGNIKSAGVGITLTKATVVVFNSFDWVTGNNEQAEDRCVFGGQLVMTNNGYKLIEDIEINDYVYTHNGNFKKVVDTHTHLEHKKTRVDINALGYNSPLSLTNDHKVYVYNNTTENFEWIECGLLDINKHSLTLKSDKQPKKRKKTLEVINYYNNNNFGFKQKNSKLKLLPENVELTNDLLYAFGFFIAEGWVNDMSETKSSIVSVCQKIDNKKMYDSAKYIIDILKESFNLNKHSEYIDKDNIKTCTIRSKNLAKNFINWFGKDVHNKQLPSWVDELNNEQLTYLLEGYYHGDGQKIKTTQAAVTASNKLGSQLIRYNANLGRGVSFCFKDNLYYNIEYTTDLTLNINKIIKIDDYIIYPIKSLHISKPKRGEERVYDLSVEDDHSFVVGNYNVHNCFRIGQKNDVNVYYQLFNNTISTRMWAMLKNKKKIINTIMGEKKLSDEEITNLLMDNLDEII